MVVSAVKQKKISFKPTIDIIGKYEFVTLKRNTQDMYNIQVVHDTVYVIDIVNPRFELSREASRDILYQGLTLIMSHALPGSICFIIPNRIHSSRS